MNNDRLARDYQSDYSTGNYPPENDSTSPLFLFPLPSLAPFSPLPP